MVASRNVPVLGAFLLVAPHVALLHKLVNARFDFCWLHFEGLNHLNDFLHQIAVLDCRVFVCLHDFHNVGVHHGLAFPVYALLHCLSLSGGLLLLGQKLNHGVLTAPLLIHGDCFVGIVKFGNFVHLLNQQPLFGIAHDQQALVKLPLRNISAFLQLFIGPGLSLVELVENSSLEHIDSQVVGLGREERDHL